LSALLRTLELSRVTIIGPFNAMACRLCLKEKLLQKSHIVPEFVYKELYNNKHQLFALSGTTKAQILQKGAREPLLCWDCEQKFSRYEDYAAKTLFGPNVARGVVQGPFKVLSGLDYRNLKLFLLSILWRFGETSLPMLTGARLGPHREILRKLLDVANPGHHSLYPCVITDVSLDGKSLRQWIIPPKRSRFDSHWVWNMVLGSYLLSFYVSNHPVHVPIALMALNQEGTLRIYQSDIRNIPSLLQIALRLREADI
jgi:hypothetical protein